MAHDQSKLLEGALDWIRCAVDPDGAYYEPHEDFDAHLFACGKHFSSVSGSVPHRWNGTPEALGRAIYEKRDTTKDESEKIETTIRARWGTLRQLNQARNDSVMKLVKARQETHWAFQHVKGQGAYVLTPCMMAILTDWYLEYYGRMITICERAHGGIQFPTHEGVTYCEDPKEPYFRITGIVNRDFEEDASPAIDRAAAEREWLKFGLPYPMPDYFAKPKQAALAGAKSPESPSGGTNTQGGVPATNGRGL